MPYDESLAARVRVLVHDELDVTEKRMFGGLAYLAGGHLAVAASGQGGLLVRCDGEETERLLELPGVAPFRMRGRALRGWLHVTGPALTEDEMLREWVETGLDRARSEPSG